MVWSNNKRLGWHVKALWFRFWVSIGFIGIGACSNMLWEGSGNIEILLGVWNIATNIPMLLLEIRLLFPKLFKWWELK